MKVGFVLSKKNLLNVSKVEMAKVTKIVEEKVKAQSEPKLKRTLPAIRGFRSSIFRRIKDRLSVRKRRIANAKRNLRPLLAQNNVN